MKDAKRKGTRNEHRAIRILEATGYSCTRAAASLGMFDVIAIGRQGMRLIQVKSNRDASPLEREQIALFRTPPGCSKEVWIFHDYAREPLIKEIP